MTTSAVITTFSTIYYRKNLCRYYWLKVTEAILTSCWLGGDESIKSNDDKFLAVSGKLEKVVEMAEAEVKEL
jgi:hypothetical protein